MNALMMLAVLAVAVPDRPNRTPQPEVIQSLPEQIVGDWLLVKHVIGGNEVPPNGLSMVITRESLRHVYLQKELNPTAGTYPYTLDLARNPPVLHFPTTKYIGIVKVEGDVLTICFSRVGEIDPPLAFSSLPDSSVTLLQATRIKK